MTEVDGTLILNILQKIQADMAELKQDVRDLTVRQTVLESRFTGLMVSVQLINEQLDRLRDDVRLVKRCLDLVDAE